MHGGVLPSPPNRGDRYRAVRRTELQLAIYRMKHRWSRFGLAVRLRPAKLGPAIGIGIIVGLGMAASGWSIGQSPLWLGLGSGIGAFVLVLAS